MIFVESLEIDDHVLEKIETKHGVSFGEVEAACYSEKRHVRKGKEGLYKFFGQTGAGRYVLVVLADHGKGSWKAVTARDMTDSERRLYEKATGVK
ncbi:MAG: BrnT family toxin [Chloroflexi bacterium]|nr:BrnT family toxin [Chloroflexota bacterium]